MVHDRGEVGWVKTGIEKLAHCLFGAIKCSKPVKRSACCAEVPKHLSACVAAPCCMLAYLPPCC